MMKHQQELLKLTMQLRLLRQVVLRRVVRDTNFELKIYLPPFSVSIFSLLKVNLLQKIGNRTLGNL